MTISTSVHSNAFNFMSFLQNGVDPRTGQYTVSITLPDVKCNGLRGPGLPLALNYNPLNEQDSGFGLGWSLQLSQYVPGTQILSLSSGETYKVDGTQGDQLTMSEKKLDSFHFYKQDATHYRLMHKSGLMEILEEVGATGHKVALPKRVLAPEGHGLTLSYAPFDSTHMMLSEVKDDAGQVLLSIERDGDTAVRIALHAPQVEPVRFVMILSGADRHVTRIELPTDNAASWRFGYERFLEHLCMKTVDTPVGGHEEIFYNDGGHAFPDNAGRQPLPRVTRHLIVPGFGQADVDVHYGYADSQGREHNFLGAGLDIAWQDNGLDNLYRYRGAGGYDYVSTETLRVEGEDVRSVERIFNQFHLLTSEITTQNEAAHEVKTTYHLLPDRPFAEQPNYCQLPKEVTTTWRWLKDARVPRNETVSTTYDIHGNLLVQTQANGVEETSVWYPASGEEGCPADPEGFVRSIKSKTVTPARSEHGQAPTLATRYRYTSLAALDGSGREDWLAMQSETLVQLDSGLRQRLRSTAYGLIDELTTGKADRKRSLRRSAHAFIDSLVRLAGGEQQNLRRQAYDLVGLVVKLAPGIGNALHNAVRQVIDSLLEQVPEAEQELQCTTYDYIDDVHDAFQHGRVGVETLTMNGQATATAFVYSTLDSPALKESVQRTVQTVTGFDGATKTVTLEHSLFTGEPLLNRDDNDVEIRYTYDSLRRVLSETVAPDTPYTATRNYKYQLCASTADQAGQELSDVKNVKTCSRFDGLHRVVYEERDDADNLAKLELEKNVVVQLKLKDTAPATAPATEKSVKAVLENLKTQQSGEPRQTYAAVYDAWGHLIEETEYDWLEAYALALTSAVEYDDWGEQRCVTGPDGVRTVEETDPVGTPESQGPIQRSWTESSGESAVKSGVSETWLNLFEKPTRSVRLDLADKQISLSVYHYDGLGRSAEEIVGSGDLARSTLYTYDAFDRVVETTLPDGSLVRHTFATHSSEDLPTCVSVEHNATLSVLGEQVYDGLDRMVKSITGGRERSFVYDPGQMQPAQVTTPSGQLIKYEYEPQLGSEPKSRAIPGADAVYTYDNKNARLVSSSEQGEALNREYYSTGELKNETRVSAGDAKDMFYVYSRLGRLRLYADVLEQNQGYTYDAHGRLTQTSLDTLCSDFTYDALGRTASIHTEDSASGQYVTVDLEYDDLGREILRTFNLNGTEQKLVQVYDDVDDMVKRTLSEGGTVLRDEDYGYDARGRLVNYTCSGTLKPVGPEGDPIHAQTFIFDGMDNLTLVNTTTEKGIILAQYRYEGDDPVQLSRIVKSGYLPREEILLDYDPDGNLTFDEAGRTLLYDALGRLIEVGTLPHTTRHNFGPDDQRSGTTRNGNTDRLFYRDGTLANQVSGNQGSTFMRGDGEVIAQVQNGKAVLLATDDNRSVLTEVQVEGVNQGAYTAYGHRSSQPPPVSRLAFNGEYTESDTGWQLLGNGYRAYNPTLMRFHSPDSLSPFGKAGLNAYAYCNGDPVNAVDPDGHAGWFSRLFSSRNVLTTQSMEAQSIPSALKQTAKYSGAKKLHKITDKDVKNYETIKEALQERYDSAVKRLNSKTSGYERSGYAKNKEAVSRELESYRSEAAQMEARLETSKKTYLYLRSHKGKPGITGMSRDLIRKEKEGLGQEEMNQRLGANKQIIAGLSAQDKHGRNRYAQK